MKPGETIASIAFLVFVIAAIIFSRNVSPVAAGDGTAITVFDPEMWSFWLPYFVAVLTFEIIFGWRGEPAGDGLVVLLASVTIGAIAVWEIFDGFRKVSR